MTKKGLMLLFSCVFIILIITGCGKKEIKTEDIIKQLKEIESYSCNIEIHNKNSKQEIVYDCMQYYNRKYGHRLDINDERVLIFKGNDIQINDLNSGTFYLTSKNFDSVFKLSFIEEYIGLLYTDEEVKCVFENENGRNIMLIYLNIPGSNRNLNRAVMYVDAENAIPIKTVIYDFNDSEKIQFIYKNFTTTEEIGEERFKIE
ncbi:germination lipoprotein GerS-related protein [Clostridium sediminicola]|uniref:germination lipoprotein GerS-related protein n=1 Tax=Clostridium sediminicola TaxID=3114879 RepID=UPI0031F273A7